MTEGQLRVARDRRRLTAVWAAFALLLTTLVLFFALLSPPTLTAGESPSAAYGLLLTGPLLSAVALLFLLRYLKAASAEAERRHKAKTTPANSTG